MSVPTFAIQKEENLKDDITPIMEYFKEEALKGQEVPVINYPQNGDVFSDDMNVNISFEYNGDSPCYVLVSGIGSVSAVDAKDNKATISAGKLVNGKTYRIRVSDGSVYSDVVEFSIDNDGSKKAIQDIENIIATIPNPDIPKSKMFPNGIFRSADEAEAAMKTITVPVWRLKFTDDVVTEAREEEQTQEETEDITTTETEETIAETAAETLTEAETQVVDPAADTTAVEADTETTTETAEEKVEAPKPKESTKKSVGSYTKYPSTTRITVNAAVADKVKAIFQELYLGTAIDINPDENYCLYSDGSVTGSLYAPGENPYSVTSKEVDIFEKYGFHWGGKWKGTIDYMHFSYYDT